MEEEADRTGICPLEIVQDQEQRVTPRQELQDTGHLVRTDRPAAGRITGSGSPPGGCPNRLSWVLSTPHAAARPAKASARSSILSTSGTKVSSRSGPASSSAVKSIGQNGPQTSGMPPASETAEARLASMSPLSNCRISRKGRYESPIPAVGALQLPPGHHQFRVCHHRLAGKFTEQSCLAAPRLAGDEGHLPRRRRPAGESLQLSQLILARDKRWGWGNIRQLDKGEGVRLVFRFYLFPGLPMSPAYRLVPDDRLFRRLDTELVSEQIAARVVLVQCGVAPTVQSQHAHQRPMGCLTPGFQGDLLAGAGLGRRIITARL